MLATWRRLSTSRALLASCHAALRDDKQASWTAGAQEPHACSGNPVRSMSARLSSIHGWTARCAQRPCQEPPAPATQPASLLPTSTSACPASAGSNRTTKPTACSALALITPALCGCLAPTTTRGGKTCSGSKPYTCCHMLCAETAPLEWCILPPSETSNA